MDEVAHPVEREPVATGVAATPLGVLAVFEGGGAKGIAHIGAYQAACDIGLTITHVAGTSAGAIIAALIAAGFAPQEIMDPSQRGATVLARLRGITPVDLFGSLEWRSFRWFRGAWAFLGAWWAGAGAHGAARMTTDALNAIARLVLDTLWLVPVLLWAARGALAATAISVLGRAARPPSGGVRTRAWVTRWRRRIRRGLERTVRPVTVTIYRILAMGSAVLPIIAATAVTLAIFALRYGWFNTARARRELNAILWCKLNDASEAPDPCPDVLFADLPLDLKVVATNLTTGATHVFDRHLEPTVPVADAVAASICIPFVFRPKIIGGVRFVDGGLVSNLPVWLFDEERLAHPAKPTIAFRLESDGAGTPRTFLDYLKAVGRSAVFGGQSVGMRAIDNMVSVSLPAGIDMMDFDLTWDDAVRVHEQAQRMADRVLAEEVINIPNLMVRFCRAVHDVVLETMPDDQTRVRVNIALMSKNLRGFLRVQYSYGMNSDADDRLFLPLGASVAGQAFRSKTIVHRRQATLGRLGLPGMENKYRRALVWRGMEECLSVPVFREEAAWDDEAPDQIRTPLGTINVDSDGDLSHILQDRETLMAFSRSLAKMLLDQPGHGGEDYGRNQAVG